MQITTRPTHDNFWDMVYTMEHMHPEACYEVTIINIRRGYNEDTGSYNVTERKQALKEVYFTNGSKVQARHISRRPHYRGEPELIDVDGNRIEPARIDRIILTLNEYDPFDLR